MGKIVKYAGIGFFGILASFGVIKSSESSLEQEFAEEAELVSADDDVFETVEEPEAVQLEETPVVQEPEIETPIKLSDLDDSDKAIRLAILQSGNLCAKPIEVRPAGPEGLYGVRCITHRNGSGRANYLLNTYSGEVTEI